MHSGTALPWRCRHRCSAHIACPRCLQPSVERSFSLPPAACLTAASL